MLNQCLRSLAFFQGGLKAVIWTDVFQFTVMFTGIFAVIIKVIVPIDCTYIIDVYSSKVFIKFLLIAHTLKMCIAIKFFKKYSKLVKCSLKPHWKLHY